MASFRNRKDEVKGDLPPPLASEAEDLGMVTQESGAQPRVGDANPRQPAVGHPKEEFAGMWHLDKKPRLSTILRCLWHKIRLKGESKQRRASQGSVESWRAAGMDGQAAERSPKPKGRAPGTPQEPGTCQKAPRDGEAQQEEEAASVVRVNLSMVLHLKEDGRDELVIRHEAPDEEVPRGGGGPRDETGQTEPLVQAGTSGGEEGRTTSSPQSLGLWVEDKVAATVPQGKRDGRDFNPPRAEGRSEGERRRQVWEKPQQLGEDMARWEERSTRDLEVRLMEVIPQTKTKTCPTEMGNESDLLEQGQGGTRAGPGSSEEACALVDAHADVTLVPQHQQQQDLAVHHDVPVSVGGTVNEDAQHLLTIAEPFGNGQSREDPGDDLPEQGDSPPSSSPEAGVHRVTDESTEQWWEEFPNVWARCETDCGLVAGEVEVEGQPVPFQLQRLSPADEAVVERVLRRLLRNGVVVKGKSSSNSPLQPFQKTNGDILLTLDCKAINEATPVVVPPVDLDVTKTKLIATLSPESRYFSVLHLSNASFAIPLAVSSRARFAFSFKDQQYLFTRLPQGFHSTTSIVHQWVEQMLSQLVPEDRPWVVSFIDVILIAGVTQAATEARTREVLKLIQETGFKAKFETAQLVQRKVVYLEMTIGAKGRKIQASKLEAISRAPRPRDIRSLRSLLRQFGSMKDLVPNYWNLAWPLHCLIREEVEWEWGEEQEQALSRLKNAVLRAPALRFPNKSQTFVVKLTTSNWAVGATLLQEGARGRLVPVGYSSRILDDCEVSYQLKEKRCLAAIGAMQAFGPLTGLATVLIQVPYSPRKYLLRAGALGSHGMNLHPAPWSLLLVNGGVKVRGVLASGTQPEGGHCRSSSVPTAPPLQQLPCRVPKANVWFLAVENGCSIGFAAINLEERCLLGAEERSSVPHVALVALMELLCRHRCSSPLYLYTSCRSLVESLQRQRDEWGREPRAVSGNDLWVRILRWVRGAPGMLHIRYIGGDGSVDPRERNWSEEAGRRAREMSRRAVGSQQIWEPSRHQKQEIITRCHSWMHEGAEETLARVRQVASWEGDREQVARWVRSCPECAAGREGSGRVQPQRAEGPWSQLQLGCIPHLPETQEGHRCLAVVEDVFSGWVEAFPLQEETEQEMARVLREEVFARYGTPSIISLLPVPCLLQRVGQLVMEASGMELTWAILQPEQVGPATAILERLLRGAGREWVKMLPLILAGLRAIRARGAALSPYQIISGFPLEMRWGCSGDDRPSGNVLPWLRRLEEDEHGYRHRVEEVLLGAAQRGTLL